MSSRRSVPVGAGTRHSAVHAPGQLAGFVGLCLDITEQREASEAMRQSEAFRRSVFENSPDCLNIFDLDGRMLENESGR